MRPDARRSPSAPSPDDIQRIVAIANPVVRNLEITYCYSRLAAACAARIGEGANWCTYATWASRQAGRTIRGEDLLEHLGGRLGQSRWVLHPIATLWRRLLRRGLFQHDTRIGRLTAELHTPFDAFERASDASRARQPEGVRGDRARVRALSPRLPTGRTGRLPAVQRFLDRSATRRPARRAALAAPGVRALPAPAVRARSEGARGARPAREPGNRPPRADAPAAGDPRGARYRVRHAGDLGRRALEALFPSATRWWPFVRRPAAAVDRRVAARAIQRASSRLAREVITDSFMILSLPGRVLALGTHLADAYPDALAEPADSELNELLARFEPVAPAPDDCGARDWSDLASADALHRAPVLNVPPEREAVRAALQPGSGGELRPRGHPGGRPVTEPVSNPFAHAARTHER